MDNKLHKAMKDNLTELEVRSSMHPEQLTLVHSLLSIQLFGEEHKGYTRLQMLAALRDKVEREIEWQAGYEGNATSKTWEQIAAELGLKRSTPHARYSKFHNTKK